MIKKECLERPWIEQIAKSKQSDKILVEKVIRALTLLEGLVEANLNFVFKGGTALMLMLSKSRRLSIDIDIIIEDTNDDIVQTLELTREQKCFLRFEKQERTVNTSIKKEHYKFYYFSVVENKESYILLDILKESTHYLHFAEPSIESEFIVHQGSVTNVKTPDFNNLLGDKLTAFAPCTTGIPYVRGSKEMGLEIIKQLYDISTLFDYADNITEVSKVFRRFAETELRYRGSTMPIDSVLNDILDHSMEICLRGTYGKCNYEVLSQGIKRVSGFTFFESFHLQKAIICASKSAYLANLIKMGKTNFSRFKSESIPQMQSWQIQAPNSKLNKLKKTEIEAFYYWYHVLEIDTRPQ